jgi:diguanylate cyclase (GGDEF)-like protein/PAS domain S-box-containing protein
MRSLVTTDGSYPVGDPALLVERSTPFTRGEARSLERAGFVGALRACSSRPRGVVYVGLDRFRGVNALLGQEKGDAVLDVIEQRISAAFDDHVVLTRVRGSDFAILLTDCADRSIVRAAASRLRDRLTGWLRIEGDRVAVTVTAGVAWSDDDGSIDLLEEAYLSSRQEKSQRAATSGEHTPLDDGILLDELRRAIEKDELRLLYQPQIDARSGLLLCAEALVRWQHPVRGLLGPQAFLPLAEDSGLMEPLGDWVIDRGARQARAWLDAYGGRGIPVGVNLSAGQVGQGERIARVLGAALVRYSLSGTSLVVEVTESSLVTDLPGAARTLSAIRTLGIDVALDDFGTGYSSLSYLRQLPVSTVKIDRSFVTGPDGSIEDPVIIEAVTRLAHTLGLRVVAEGVEELSQAEALIELDVDELQGYYFARPLDPDGYGAAMVGGTWWGRPPPRNATGPEDDESGAMPMPGGPRARLLMTRAVDAAPAPVVVLARSHGDAGGGPVMHVNPAFERMTGFLSSELRGRPLSELLDPSTERVIAERLSHSFTVSLPSMVRVRIRSSWGVPIPVELDATLVDDERGLSTQWIVSLRDLRSEARNEAEHFRFQWLVENSASLIALADIDGKLTFMNRAGRELTGFTGEAGLLSLHGYSMQEVISTSGAAIGAGLAESGHWCGELAMPVVGAAPTPVWVDVMLVPDPADTEHGSLAIIAHPLTDQARNERAVVRHMKGDLDHQPDAPAFLAPDGMLPYVNSAFAELIEASIATHAASTGDDGPAESRRRDRLPKLAIDVAQRGLDLGPRGFVAHLSDVLAEIADELNVDIVYVDSFDHASGRSLELGSFRRSGRADIDEASEGPDLSRLASWLEAIDSVNVLVVEDSLTEDAPWLREKAAVFNVVSRAMISVPLRAGVRLLGAMSVETMERPRKWSVDEIAFVRQVSLVIANLLELGRVNEERDRSQAHLGVVLEHSFDGMAMLDPQGLITYVNRAGGELLGVPAPELVGRTLIEFIEPEDASLALDLFEKNLGAPALGLVRVRRHGDSVIWVEASVTRLVDGQIEGFVVNGRDVTGRVLADAAFSRRAGFDELAASVAQRALDLGPATFVERLSDVTAALGRMLRVDVCFVDLAEDGYLRNIASWAAPGHPPSTFAVEPVLLDSLPEWRDHLLGLRPLVVDNTLSPDYVEPDGQNPGDAKSIAYIACPLTAHGLLCGVLGVSMTTGARTWSHDETALVHAFAVTIGSVLQWQKADRLRRDSEERLQRLVRTDGLTGLANRLALREMLDAIESSPDEHPSIAAMVIDLDQFKAPNDRHGHDIGDDLLCRLATRFDAVVPEAALLARTGGDEFVVIALGLDAAAVATLADQIVAAASATIEAGDERLVIGASVGIVIVPAGNGPVRNSIRLADQAMCEAKRLGGGRWELSR